jgi:hypothetical protein
MRIATALVASLFALYGCTTRDGNKNNEIPALEPLARGLKEAWPHSTYDINMTILVAQVNGHEVLRCRLENTSANTIELNSSTLPWVTPGLFDFAAVTAAGKVVRRNGFVNQLMNMPASVFIAPGGTLEGNVDWAYMPIGELPRNEDILLVWSHGLDIIRGTGPTVVSGITFLPKRPH